MTLCIEKYGVIETKIAVMGDYTQTSTNSDTSREQPTSPSTSKVTRTKTTSAKQIREVRPIILNSKNMIPNCLPSTLLTIEGVEHFVSESLSDPSIHIHTVTKFESEN